MPHFHYPGINTARSNTYWTETNIANGLNALAICIEMVFFSALMWWAYNVREYKKPGVPATSIWRPLSDSINYTDFFLEIGTSIRFFIDYARGKPTAHGHGHRVQDDLHGHTKMDFGQAFRVAAPRLQVYNMIPVPANGGVQQRRGEQAEYASTSVAPVRPSYDEHVRLAPYAYPEPVRDEVGVAR